MPSWWPWTGWNRGPGEAFRNEFHGGGHDPVRHGAWIGSNQDGGGSTTLVIRDEVDGQPTILNQPCGEDAYMCRNRDVQNPTRRQYLRHTLPGIEARSSKAPAKRGLTPPLDRTEAHSAEAFLNSRGVPCCQNCRR